jgi:hypothetical protein
MFAGDDIGCCPYLTTRARSEAVVIVDRENPLGSTHCGRNRKVGFYPFRSLLNSWGRQRLAFEIWVVF